MPASAWFDSIERAHGQLGRKAFVPCCEILLYGTAERSAFHAAVVTAMRVVRQRFPGALGWYKTSTMKLARQSGAEPVTIASNFLTSLQLKPPKLAGIEFHSGKAKDDFDVPAVDFFSTIVPTSSEDRRQSRTYLRLALPASLSEEPDELRTVCREVMEQCPLYAGHCGWSFYWSVVHPKEKEVLRAHAPMWLRRFPGLSYGNPLVFLEFIGDGLLEVSWLTYVGTGALEGRGRTLEQALETLRAAGVAASVVSDGTIEVQAGPAPALGDRNRNDRLPAYRDVAGALSWLKLAPGQSQYIGVLGLGPEERTEWHERFFDSD